MRRNADPAHRRTDKALANLEKRIAEEYKKAAKELQEKIDAYFAQFRERDVQERKRLEAGEITRQEYTQWRLAQIGRGKRFEALRDRVAERMTKANEVAAAYMNDATPGIYSLNRNYADYTIEQQVGANVGFHLWDEQTVRRLIVEQPDLMPYYPPKRAVKRGIDLDWGKRQITAQVTSGILQGESIKHIADRLQDNIPRMNRDSAVRAARTAVTGAQNAGRLDSYQQAEAMGIQLEKQWLATLDDRTRHDHAVADGQTVSKDEPFIVGGEALMFPGDPSGSGWNIYNCRCTMIAKVKGVDTSDSLRRDRYGLLPNMTYAQWEASKRGQGAIAEEQAERRRTDSNNQDRKQYEEYKSVLGKNAPKSFAEFQNLKYNSGEYNSFKAYKKAIQTGELSALTDFALYQKTSREIDDILVGTMTSNGIQITGKSSHFIARVIGSVEQRRSGVEMDHILAALTSQEATARPVRVSPNGNTSQKFRFGTVEVSINPSTGNLIQVNPYGG